MSTITSTNAADSKITNGLADQATRAMENVAQGAHQTIDRVAERVAPAAAKLNTGVDQASAALKAGVDQFSTVVEGARNRVRENPMISIAVVAGAGLLLARLLRR